MIQGFQIFAAWMGTMIGGMYLSGRIGLCVAMAEIAVTGQRLDRSKPRPRHVTLWEP